LLHGLLHSWLHHLGLTHRLLLVLNLLLHVLLHRLHHLGLTHHLWLHLHRLLHHLRLHMCLLVVDLLLHSHLHRLHHHVGLRLLHHGLLHHLGLHLTHLLVKTHRSNRCRLSHAHGEHLSHLCSISEPSILLNGLWRLLRCCSCSTVRSPLTSKIYLSSRLTFIRNCKPFIKTSW
jgi:hypothetical protein